MRKTLSLITVLLGFFQILFGALMLGHIGELATKTIEGLGRDIYAIFIIIFGISIFWSGFFTLKNPGKRSSIILLGIFTINVIILIINGWSNGLTMSLLIINGICAITLLIYLVINSINKNKKNQKKNQKKKNC